MIESIIITLVLVIAFITELSFWQEWPLSEVGLRVKFFYWLFKSIWYGLLIWIIIEAFKSYFCS